MKPETPATQIAKLEDRPTWKRFRVDCNCGEPSCNHIVDVDFDEDDVVVSVYTQQHTSAWRASRWQQIWQLLTTGVIKYESASLFSKQVALNYAAALQSAIDEIEQTKNEPKN
jgi:hypothetical protein